MYEELLKDFLKFVEKVEEVYMEVNISDIDFEKISEMSIQLDLTKKYLEGLKND